MDVEYFGIRYEARVSDNSEKSNTKPSEFGASFRAYMDGERRKW